MRLVLSLFPGLDLLGEGFRREGYCVVQAPDRILGGDVARFRAAPGLFHGIIGSPPADQEDAFWKVAQQAKPDWFLLEHSGPEPATSPLVYLTESHVLTAPGGNPRTFCFGSREGRKLEIEESGQPTAQPRIPASDWTEVLREKGGDPAWLLHLPSDRLRWRLAQAAVPLPLARCLAHAIRDATDR